MKAAIFTAVARKFIALLISVFTLFGASAPAALPQNPVAPDADVRIVSFNLRTTGFGKTSVAYRAPLMADTLKALGADSMGFQEANLRWMTYLEDNLTDYAYVGAGRDDGGVGGEFSPVFYLKEKYNLIDGGTFWLSDTPDKPGSKYASSAYPRICSWALLENKATGERYCHMNAHLDHISSEARAEQIKVLLGRAGSLSGGCPVVLTGDFNDVPGSETYRIATSVYTDARLAAPVTEDKATYHNYGNAPVPTLLDYVFVSDGVTPLVYHVIDDAPDGVYLSDHYGIYVDAALARG